MPPFAPAFAAGKRNSGSPVRALIHAMDESPQAVKSTRLPSRNENVGCENVLSCGRSAGDESQTSSPVFLSKANMRSPAGPFAPHPLVTPRVMTSSRSIIGVAVREFGNVRRPNFSIIECCHTSLPAGVKHESSPCVPCTKTLPVSGSIVGALVE